MLAKGEEIYKWLEAGAYFYVCGDAERMAKDVNQALIDIVANTVASQPMTQLRTSKTSRRKSVTSVMCIKRLASISNLKLKN